MTMLRSLFTLFIFSCACAIIGSAQATAVVKPSSLKGPRLLQEQTAAGAIRDYLQSWEKLRAAMEQNRPDILDSSFVGTAKDKLAETVQEQAKLGIHTSYKDRAHEVQIVFYSPEGLSIELTDKVEYDVQIVDRDWVKTIQHVSARYVIVLTPAEVRWRVRVFQAVSE
jgi:hypothetical protein